MINKDEITSQLNHMFLTRHQDAINTAENNLNNALKNKAVHDSFYAIRGMQIDLSRASDHESELKIREKIETERVKLRKALESTPYKKEDFVPHYQCEKCKDTGYIDGKKCTCFKAEQSKLYLHNSGINKDKLPSFSTVSLDVYKNKEDKENAEKLYKLAKEFVAKTDTTKINFIVCGKTGVGKTYMAECMVNEAIDKEVYAIFTTAYNLNQAMLNYHLAPLYSKQYILEPYMTCDMLIIDDLGSENILTNVTQEYLYLILDTRANNHLKTVITTNLTPDKVQDLYDARIFSRMFNKQLGIVVNMKGEDLRFNIK